MSSRPLPVAARGSTGRLPPGPRPRYPGQLVLAMARDRLGTLARLAADHGDVASLSIVGRPIVLLSHPDLVRDVLVTHNRMFAKGRGLEQAKRLLGNGLLTSEGELHLRQRRLVQPAFHRERIAGYAAVMAAYAEREGARWRDGETMDVAEAMMRLTLAIAGKTLFDADVEAEAGEIGAAITTAIAAFEFALMPFGEQLERLPFSPRRRFERARDRLDATIYRLVADRRRDARDRGDLLSMLIQARDTEADGGRMSDAQLRDELMTLFLAGHETTANMLTWTWHLLAAHPPVERRLHAEVDAVLGERRATADDVPRLPFTRQVLAESMRLYPPAWVIGRKPLRPYPVGGWEAPAGSLVLLSQYVVHRDGRWWPEPERFDPDRWAPEAAAERPRFAYFPFGAGTRVCIGEQFAWTEGALVLATLARRWRLRAISAAAPGMQPSITLRPRGGMRMRVERRRPGTPGDGSVPAGGTDGAIL
jgi:cytochrome P450